MRFHARTRMTIAMTLLVAMAVAIGTLTPQEHTPPALSGVDKLLHFAAFAALVLPAATLRPDLLRWLLPIVVIYGGMIEIIQPSIGRHAEWGDFVANTVGALAGAGIGRWVHLRVLRQPPPSER